MYYYSSEALELLSPGATYGLPDSGVFLHQQLASTWEKAPSDYEQNIDVKNITLRKQGETQISLHHSPF